LTFEPTYTSDVNQPVLDTWQTWDVLAGKFYSDNEGAPSLADTFTLQSYILEHPLATIIDDLGHGGIGGFRINSGFASGDAFDTNVDQIKFGTAAAGTTTYDFEPDSATPAGPAAPLPTTAYAGLALLAGVGIVSRRQKKLT
jgi:hypothetical protein